jgi:hypothetical protein
MRKWRVNCRTGVCFNSTGCQIKTKGISKFKNSFNESVNNVIERAPHEGKVRVTEDEEGVILREGCGEKGK